MSDAPVPPRTLRRRGLGRGLDALLAVSDPDEPGAESILVNVDPNSVRPNPEQPRRNFDEESLETLAESIRVHGLLHPIVVERVGDGYQLFAGERRLRAAQRAGVATIPAIVRPAAESARQSLELALTENLQRVDLDPMEEAAAYARLVDTFGLSHEAIALRLGKARPTISNAIRLLGLAPTIQLALSEGRISAAHGRAIVALPDHRQQEQLAAEVEKTGITTNALESLVQDLLARGVKHELRPALQRELGSPLSPDDDAVRRGLERALGAPVTMRRRRHGGDIIIRFASDADLANIYERIGGPPL